MSDYSFPSLPYQSNFTPNCICRDVVDVLVITPAVGETPVGVKVRAFGVLKLALFRILKISTRNCTLSRSRIRVSFRRDKSSVAKPGPLTVFLPTFPYKPL